MYCKFLMQYSPLLFWQGFRSKLFRLWNWHLSLHWWNNIGRMFAALPKRSTCRSTECEESFQFYVISLCTYRHTIWYWEHHWFRESRCALIIASFSSHIYEIILLRWSQKAVSLSIQRLPKADNLRSACSWWFAPSVLNQYVTLGLVVSTEVAWYLFCKIVMTVLSQPLQNVICENWLE